MRILQRNLNRTKDTFLFISYTTNVLLFKFRCNIFTGVRIIKEMPGSVASGTLCTTCVGLADFLTGTSYSLGGNFLFCICCEFKRKLNYRMDFVK